MKITVTSPTQLSTHFKSLRRAKGWSQADLGQKLGLGQARVAQIEGDPGSVSVDRLLQILHLVDAKLVIEVQNEPEQAERVAGSLKGQERTKAVRGRPVSEERPTRVVRGFMAENQTKRVAGRPAERERAKQEARKLTELARAKLVADAVAEYRRYLDLKRAKEPLEAKPASPNNKTRNQPSRASNLLSYEAELIENGLLPHSKSSPTSSNHSPRKKKW